MTTFPFPLPLWAWGIALALPPAVFLLYFLKLRREPRTVPSTFLWRKSIEDLHANALWQRLRRNLLLWLQLGMLLLLLIGLTGWTRQGSRLAGGRFIFLIDVSAGMQATDILPTRLEAAKKAALEHVDALPAGGVAMVISFSDQAQVEQTFTDNRAELKRRIAGIRPTIRPGSLEEALRAAAGLANPGQVRDEQPAQELGTQLYIFGDGKVPVPQDFSLGNLVPEFVSIGKPTTGNVGWTAASLRRSEERPDEFEAFGRLHNFGAAPVETVVTFSAGDALIDAARLTIPAGKAQGVVFPLREATAPEYRLKIDRPDELALDDEVRLVPPRPGRGKILLVSEGCPPLTKAFTSGRAKDLCEIRVEPPAFLGTPAYDEVCRTGNLDLIVYDRCRPAADPPTNAWYLGALPPGWESTGKDEAPVAIDVDRSDPLTAFVDLNGVMIVEGLAGWKPPPGGRVLASSTRGPLMATAARGVLRDLVVGFPLVGPEGWNTNWPVKESFAVFTWNVLRNLVLRNREDEGENLAAGELVRLRRPQGPETVVLRLPSGAERTVPRQPDGLTYRWPESTELGIHEVLWGPNDTERFGINLVSEQESDLAAAATLDFGNEAVAAVVQAERAAPEPLWKYFLLGALVLLGVEWYVFNGRLHW